MKNNRKKKTLTFGEFVAWVWGSYGRREGRRIVRHAVNARLIVFSAHARVVVVAS